MEDMLELFFAFLVIGVSLIAKVKKSENKRIANAAKQSVPAQEESPRPVHPYTPAKPAFVPASSFGDVPGQVIMPMVHPHVAPDCAAHDAPGSLGETSMEGKDPCHEAELTLARTMDAAPQPEGGLTFDWFGENMVKAFVMQEVLTRPAQRRRAQ